MDLNLRVKKDTHLRDTEYMGMFVSHLKHMRRGDRIALYTHTECNHEWFYKTLRRVGGPGYEHMFNKHIHGMDGLLEIELTNMIVTAEFVIFLVNKEGRRFMQLGSIAILRETYHA